MDAKGAIRRLGKLLRGRRSNDPQVNLADQVERWPTPTVVDSQGGTFNTSLSSGATRRPTLAKAVQFPTPTVGDSKGARNSTARRLSVRPSGIHGGDTLVDFVTKCPTRLVPTPTAQDATGHAQTLENPTPGQTGGSTLAGFVKTWPTPCARDCYSRGPTEAERNTPALNHQATGGAGGKLNPDWVEWLMGWPIGWTALEPLATDRFQQWLRQFGRC